MRVSFVASNQRDLAGKCHSFSISEDADVVRHSIQNYQFTELHSSALLGSHLFRGVPPTQVTTMPEDAAELKKFVEFLESSATAATDLRRMVWQCTCGLHYSRAPVVPFFPLVEVYCENCNAAVSPGPSRCSGSSSVATECDADVSDCQFRMAAFVRIAIMRNMNIVIQLAPMEPWQ